jgi:hypothetical protein
MSAGGSTQGACGCCAGVVARTPAGLDNRPGLSAIAYRIGTHGDFVASLHGRLSSADYPALAKLQTRDRDDYAVALLDAFACCADVLTFYQERIANESYLRTAVERRSLVEMGRLLGYRLKPGVAAETWLAFTLETASGAPEALTLEPGVKVQSVPGPDERPQVFETVERLEVRPEWNGLPARRTKTYLPAEGRKDCYLQGIDLNLKPGDGLLFVGDEVAKEGSATRWDFRPIQSVSLDTVNLRTHVSWKQGLGATPAHDVPLKNPQVHVFRRKAGVFGHNALMWQTMPEDFRKSYPGAGISISIQPLTDVQPMAAAATPVPLPSSDFAEVGPEPILFTTSQDEWPAFTIRPDAFDLDALYPQIVPLSWLVLARPDLVRLFRVSDVTERSRAAFAISAKATRLSIADPDKYGPFEFRPAVRETSVFGAPERLQFAEAPDTQPVSGNSIAVTTPAGELPSGRRVIVSGTVAGTGAPVTEVVTLAAAAPEGAGSRLTFVEKLAYTYDRSTVVVHANAVRATHGETVREILGSGDAGRAHQRFTLKQTPLTFTAAATELGAASTLDVRVDDIAWREAPTLFEADGDDRLYVLRVNDEGTAEVQFGDGRRGARLPTGRENVRAAYRKGIGSAGNVGAGTLSQLMTRPLGLKEVVNPAAAEGGADPEGRDAARRNMPLGVRTLGRAVSLRDYEDFARAFSGIAKAQAAVLNLKAGRTIFITIAGNGGARPAAGNPQLSNLVAALARSGDPHVRFEIQPFTQAFFRLGLRIKRHPDHLKEKVFAEVETALREAFSFDARDLGEPVTLSEVVAVAQRVAGVVAVDIEVLYRGASPALEQRLPAAQAGVGAAGNGVPGELLTLAPGPLDQLGEMP